MIYRVYKNVKRDSCGALHLIEFDNRDEAIKAATDCAKYGRDHVIEVWSDDKKVLYPYETIYIRGVIESNKGRY